MRISDWSSDVCSSDLGPLVGGSLSPVLGYSWLYLGDTVCLFATLFAVTALPALPIEGPASTPGLRSVIEGLRYLRGHPVLMMSFVVDLIAMIFGMPRALFPEMAHTDFGGPEIGRASCRGRGCQYV